MFRKLEAILLHLTWNDNGVSWKGSLSFNQMYIKIANVTERVMNKQREKERERDEQIYIDINRLKYGSKYWKRIWQCGEKLKNNVILSEEFNMKESWRYNILV